MRRVNALFLVLPAMTASLPPAHAESDLLPTSIVCMSVVETPGWVADGATLHRLDVRFDSTSDARPVGALVWTLTFPDALTLVDAAWPSPSFFFEGYTIDPNLSSLDHQVTATSVSGRALIYEWPGPTMVAAPVASYFFTVSPGAPTGPSQFGFGEVIIGLDDPDFNMCEPFLGVCSDEPGAYINAGFTIVPPGCIGDLDGDGDTDVFDFGAFTSFFGQSVAPGTSGDLDGNGIVDVLDFGLFAGNFGCIG